LRFGFALVKRGVGVHTEGTEEEQGGCREEGWGSIADVTMVEDWADWLPWSFRAVAGAPRTARKKKPATPVGMTA